MEKQSLKIMFLAAVSTALQAANPEPVLVQPWIDSTTLGQVWTPEPQRLVYVDQDALVDCADQATMFTTIAEKVCNNFGHSMETGKSRVIAAYKALSRTNGNYFAKGGFHFGQLISEVARLGIAQGLPDSASDPRALILPRIVNWLDGQELDPLIDGQDVISAAELLRELLQADDQDTSKFILQKELVRLALKLLLGVENGITLLHKVGIEQDNLTCGQAYVAYLSAISTTRPEIFRHKCNEHCLGKLFRDNPDFQTLVEDLKDISGPGRGCDAARTYLRWHGLTSFADSKSSLHEVVCEKDRGYLLLARRWRLLSQAHEATEELLSNLTSAIMEAFLDKYDPGAAAIVTAASAADTSRVRELEARNAELAQQLAAAQAKLAEAPKVPERATPVARDASTECGAEPAVCVAEAATQADQVNVEVDRSAEPETREFCQQTETPKADAICQAIFLCECACPTDPTDSEELEALKAALAEAQAARDAALDKVRDLEIQDAYMLAILLKGLGLAEKVNIHGQPDFQVNEDAIANLQTKVLAATDGHLGHFDGLFGTILPTVLGQGDKDIFNCKAALADMAADALGFYLKALMSFKQEAPSTSPLGPKDTQELDQWEVGFRRQLELEEIKARNMLRRQVMHTAQIQEVPAEASTERVESAPAAELVARKKAGEAAAIRKPAVDGIPSQFRQHAAQVRAAGTAAGRVRKADATEAARLKKARAEKDAKAREQQEQRVAGIRANVNAGVPRRRT